MICIIPARGNSKRIPRKNIKKMLGIPLFEWSVKIAWESDLFERIIVTTDDDEIAELASKICEVHRREKVSDTQTLQEVWDMFPKPFCCLLPNPLTKIEDLKESFRIFDNHFVDIWSAIRIQENPPIFQDAGQFYWIENFKQKMLYIVDEAIDINTQEDWDKCELLLKKKYAEV